MRVLAIVAQTSDVSFGLLFSKNANYIHFHVNHQLNHFIVKMLFFWIKEIINRTLFISILHFRLYKINNISTIYVSNIFEKLCLQKLPWVHLMSSLVCLSVCRSVILSVVHIDLQKPNVIYFWQSNSISNPFFFTIQYWIVDPKFWIKSPHIACFWNIF